MRVGEIIKTDSLPKVNNESVNPITFLLKLRYGTVLIQLSGAIVEQHSWKMIKLFCKNLILI